MLTSSKRDARTLILQVTVVAAVAGLAYATASYLGERDNFVDHKIYHAAIRWWLDGNPLYEYFRTPPMKEGFTYPPFAALCMLPMGLLPLWPAIWVSQVMIWVATIAITWWLVSPVAARHGWSRWFAVAVAIPLVAAIGPVRETFEMGQVGWYLVGAILFDVAAIKAGRKWAGVGIGLATAFKVTPGFFIVYLLVTRQWRAAATAVGTAIGATLVSAAVSPSTTWQFWTETLWQTERVGSVGANRSQSVASLLSRLQNDDFTRETSRPNLAIWAAVVLLVMGIGLWRAYKAHQAGNELAAFTITGITGALLSPISWGHHLVWVVPAIVLLVDAAASGRSGAEPAVKRPEESGAAAVKRPEESGTTATPGRRRPNLRYLIAAIAAYALFVSGIVHHFNIYKGGHHWDGGWPNVLAVNGYVLGCLALLLVVPYLTTRPAPAEAPAAAAPAEEREPQRV